MRSYKTEGIVIRRRNVGEADRLLTVFTKQHGKIIIKAKGIRRISSRRSAHVELLNFVRLSLYRGRVHSILTEAEMLNNFSSLKDNLKSVGLAYHICELVDGLCAENQENAKAFNLLFEVLSKLSEKEDEALTVSNFEKDLLFALGFTPNKTSALFNTQGFIEQILERRLKAKRLLPLFI